ncbi:MAG TPA: MFS transporter, partial [Candidatus Thermoplasmatota archaeon]|nr:MFS transporter [Candidatus Thermoplasmatota archaeon]
MADLPRGLLPLGASLALAWILISLFAGIGPQAWVALSGRVEDAGLFFALFGLAAAAGAALGGRLMDRHGRISTLVGAHVVSAVGYGIAAGAVLLRSLPAFVAGTALFSFAIGTVGLTRVVAADLAAPEVRGRAVARVQIAPLAGALLGPGLLIVGSLVGRAPSPTGRVWLLGPLLALAA